MSNSPKAVRVSGKSLASGFGGASQTSGLSDPNYSLPFFKYVELPKNVSMAGFQTDTLNLPIGIIHRVWVEFPRGCSGLVGVQIWRGPYQIFPLPGGTWLRSDNAIMNFGFTHDMTREPYEIEIRSYNLDDTYPHTIWIGLEMRGQSKDIPVQLQGLMNYLKG